MNKMRNLRLVDDSHLLLSIKIAQDRIDRATKSIGEIEEARSFWLKEIQEIKRELYRRNWKG